jgi:hypothetical protein
MAFETSEIDAEALEELETDSATKVEMDAIRVITYEESDAGETMLYTEGVGPCMTIILTGQVEEQDEMEQAQDYIAMYHWSGGTEDQIRRFSNRPAKEQGVALANIALSELITEIKRVLCQNPQNSHATFASTVSKIAVLGGERARQNLTGTEMQVQGLQDFLASQNAKQQFSQQHDVNLPNLTSMEVFKSSDERAMDVYVGLGTDSNIKVQYILRDTEELQQSSERSESDELENVALNEYELEAARKLASLKHGSWKI